MCGPMAQWIRHLTMNQGTPGSNPGGVDYFSYEKTRKMFTLLVSSFNSVK